MGEWDLHFLRRPLSDQPEFRITERMLRGAGIGRSYWPVQISDIPDVCDYKRTLSEMVANLVVDEARGKGAIFYGKFGRGKTSAATIMLKSCMVRGGQVFHLKATAAEHAFEKRWADQTSEGVPIWDMLTKSQVVTLDDLGAEIVQSGYKAGDNRVIEQLIRDRYDDRLLTYVTTNLEIDNLAKIYPSLRSIFLDGSRYRIVSVDGHNWRYNGDDDAGSS